MTQIRPYVRRTEAIADLGNITRELQAWKANEGTDSKTIESLRASSLRLARVGLEHLYYHLEPAAAVTITTGDKPVEASRFRKGAYDILNEVTEPLEPGTTIPYELIEAMDWTDGRGITFYVGSYACLLSLPNLAETLAYGGQFNVIDNPVFVIDGAE